VNIYSLESLTTDRNFEVDISGHVAWASKCIALFFLTYELLFFQFNI